MMTFETACGSGSNGSSACWKTSRPTDTRRVGRVQMRHLDDGSDEVDRFVGAGWGAAPRRSASRRPHRSPSLSRQSPSSFLARTVYPLRISPPIIAPNESAVCSSALTLSRGGQFTDVNEVTRTGRGFVQATRTPGGGVRLQRHSSEKIFPPGLRVGADELASPASARDLPGRVGRVAVVDDRGLSCYRGTLEVRGLNLSPVNDSVARRKSVCGRATCQQVDLSGARRREPFRFPAMPALSGRHAACSNRSPRA